MQRLRGLYILNEDAHRMIYGLSERRAIEQHVEMVGPPQTRSSIAENKGLLRACVRSQWPRDDTIFGRHQGATTRRID